MLSASLARACLASNSSKFPRDLADQWCVRILVAEDTAFWRMKLEDVLAGTGHEVVWAGDGMEAWRLLTGGDRIDLLITDWEMPVSNGVDLCKHIRSRPRTPYLPIILLTSRDERKDLAEALNAGADAFVTKPINAAELLAQIGVAERILKLEQRLDAKVRDLTLAKNRLDRDLEAAAAIQRSLFPEESPDFPGVEFAWVYDSCEIVGGDMFNVIRLTDDEVGMYVLDVSGHGTSAALLSVGLSHVLMPFPEQGGILKRNRPGSSEPEVTPPCEVALELNRRYPLMAKSRQYLTFIYGIFDLSTLVFRYVCAGHPGPIQISGGCAISHDRGGGIPVGIAGNTRYRDEVIALEPGDALVVYTDGVTETLNQENEEFGLDRVLETLSSAKGNGISQRLDVLRTRIQEFGEGRRLRDDVTMVGFGLVS